VRESSGQQAEKIACKKENLTNIFVNNVQQIKKT
jgi:hypothetical protein